RAADWANWRGPTHNGAAADDAKNLPAEFGPDKNVLWAAKLPGPSNNTPIVLGDRVFVTAIDVGRNMLCMAVDRKTGKELWRHDAGVAQIKPKGKEADVASPSPVTDGKVVVFLFGTGDIVALDLDGKKLWARNLQREVGAWNVNWIYGSSPTLWKGKLYVQVLHATKPYGNTQLPGAKDPGDDAPSYLLALDPATGKQLWRVDRPTDAVQETRESYGTPIPHKTAAGREELLLIGGDAITGHDPETGKEIWRFTGWDPNREPYWRLVPSVVAGGGYVIGCAPKKGPVMAVKEGGVGDVSATHKAWFSNGKELTSDVPVPLYYKDHFFVLEETGGKLSKVEPATGKVLWAARLEGSKAVARASPTGADNKIYCLNSAGDVWVVSPDDGKVLAKTSLGGNVGSAPSRGSVVALDGMLLIRSGDTLYAFGEKK
ncbi:MAG TPA: PQQ-binding-like beta-propeller repeat protein, partial [Humisphaera sp.]